MVVNRLFLLARTVGAGSGICGEGNQTVVRAAGRVRPGTAVRREHAKRQRSTTHACVARNASTADEVRIGHSVICGPLRRAPQRLNLVRSSRKGPATTRAHLSIALVSKRSSSARGGLQAGRRENAFPQSTDVSQGNLEAPGECRKQHRSNISLDRTATCFTGKPSRSAKGASV